MISETVKDLQTILLFAVNVIFSARVWELRYIVRILQIKYETSEIRFISASDNITVRLKNREKLIIRSMPHEKSNKEKFAKIINVIKKSCPDADIRA